MSLLAELKRRNVFRVALAYAVIAWLLMQIGDTMAPALLLPEWSTRFLAFLLILGFPLALFLAWAFELTPEGIKPEKSVEREKSITAKTGRKLDVLIIALLAIGVAYFAWDKFSVSGENPAESQVTATTPTPERRSIAVLPFVNMSNDAEQEYFSDGLSEELLNLLAKIPQLRVTSRSSAFYFKGKDYTIADVGEQLGVSHVLEGSVRRSGKQIRVTAQLIDVSNDAHLWSETWDREFEDVFAIQDEIAEAVTSALKIQLVDELPHAFITEPHAYDLFLRARELVGEQTEASVVEAESLLLELLDIDPDYPPALALLGESAMFLGLWQFRPSDWSFELAREYGQRAVAASPTFADGYVVLSGVALRHERNWRKAQNLIEEAVRRDPTNLRARLRASFYASQSGDHDLRIELVREYVRRDPLSGRSYWALGHVMKDARQYDESVEAFRQYLVVSPDAPAAHAALAEALLLAGDYEAALAEFDAEPWDGFTLYGRAMTYHEMGEQEESDAAMTALLNLDDAESWAAQIAMAHAVRGENDDALSWLDRALEQNDQGIYTAQTNPFFANLRGDPRFADFVERLVSGGDQKHR